MIRVKYDRVSVSVSGPRTARIAPDIGGRTAAAGRVMQWPCSSSEKREALVVAGRTAWAEWCWREMPFQTARRGLVSGDRRGASRAARRYPKHCAWLT